MAVSLAEQKEVIQAGIVEALVCMNIASRIIREDMGSDITGLASLLYGLSRDQVVRFIDLGGEVLDKMDMEGERVGVEKCIKKYL